MELCLIKDVRRGDQGGYYCSTGKTRCCRWSSEWVRLLIECINLAQGAPEEDKHVSAEEMVISIHNKLFDELFISNGKIWHCFGKYKIAA